MIISLSGVLLHKFPLLESHILWKISWRKDAKDLAGRHGLPFGTLTGSSLEDIR